MDFKQTIIDNAWGGLSLDYGLLHLQLATPTAVFFVICVLIVTLNKFLFQPVLRTLDNRKKVIESSQNRIAQINEELELLKDDFQQKLNKVKTEVLHLGNTGHEKGVSEREAMIKAEREVLLAEHEKNIKELGNEIEEAKSHFAKLNQEISDSISRKLLG